MSDDGSMIVVSMMSVDRRERIGTICRSEAPVFTGGSSQKCGRPLRMMQHLQRLAHSAAPKNSGAP